MNSLTLIGNVLLGLFVIFVLAYVFGPREVEGFIMPAVICAVVGFVLRKIGKRNERKEVAA